VRRFTRNDNRPGREQHRILDCLLEDQENYMTLTTTTQSPQKAWNLAQLRQTQLRSTTPVKEMAGADSTDRTGQEAKSGETANDSEEMEPNSSWRKSEIQNNIQYTPPKVQRTTDPCRGAISTRNTSRPRPIGRNGKMEETEWKKKTHMERTGIKNAKQLSYNTGAAHEQASIQINGDS
jgi:hypothetical protein